MRNPESNEIHWISGFPYVIIDNSYPVGANPDGREAKISGTSAYRFPDSGR